MSHYGTVVFYLVQLMRICIDIYFWTMESITCLQDFEAEAKRVISKKIIDFWENGAMHNQTATDNKEAYHR